MGYNGGVLFGDPGLAVEPAGVGCLWFERRFLDHRADVLPQVDAHRFERKQGGRGAAVEEKTRNGILSTLRIRGELSSAVALGDIQDGIHALPEPVTYFPVRLAFVDKL